MNKELSEYSVSQNTSKYVTRLGLSGCMVVLLTQDPVGSGPRIAPCFNSASPTNITLSSSFSCKNGVPERRGEVSSHFQKINCELR